MEICKLSVHRPRSFYKMALEAINTSPSVDEFTLLSEHQAQTPGTFFGGKTVLHLRSPGASVKISREDIESHPALLALRDPDNTTEEEELLVIKGVDIWVTSRSVISTLV